MYLLSPLSQEGERKERRTRKSNGGKVGDVGDGWHLLEISVPQPEIVCPASSMSTAHPL